MGKKRKNGVSRDEVVQELAKIAFGKANDCMKLIQEENAPVDGLDLSLLKEVKRYSQGVEVKLLDRLQALKQLAELMPDGENAQLEALVRTLKDGQTP